MTLLNRIKWLSIAPLVSLFSYRCIGFDEFGGEPILVYSEVKAPVLRETVVTYTRDSHLAYVTDDTVRVKAEDVLSEVERLPAVSTDSVQSGISIKLNGRVFAYGRPKRRYFTFEYPGADGAWTYEIIRPDTDTEALKASLHAAYARSTSGSQPGSAADSAKASLSVRC